jgi:hypothetical protein
VLDAPITSENNAYLIVTRVYIIMNPLHDFIDFPLGYLGMQFLDALGTPLVGI